MSTTTIYDVAGAAGVSLATVSRVLNNPEKVKPETRERVLKVIKELGYRPNVIARGLASRKTTTVGVVISDITRASVAEMLGGIQDIAITYKYSIKIFTIPEDANVKDKLQDIIAEQVDGVLYLNDELSDKDVEVVKKTFGDHNIPYVFANVFTADPVVPLVTIDYQKAAYEMTKELVSRGCKDIYMLSTARRYSVNDKKEEGYIKAMNELGLTPRVFRTSGNTSISIPHFETFFSDKHVDGAIAVRDSIAVAFLNIAINNGKHVPADLKVAGFQNTKYAELSRPQLTSIDIPVYDIGAVAMRLLTKLMQNDSAENTRVILPHRVIYRQSI